VTLVEISSVRRNFENLRLKNGPYERILLESLRMEGVRQPLRGLFRQDEKGEDGFILLDGFKRLRSLIKLGVPSVPVERIGTGEVQAVCELLFQSSEKSLNILEQAAFCDYLHARHKLGVLKIAEALKKSPAWVSLRLGILEKMNPRVREELFQGRFPARSYLYTLKSFTRVNDLPKKDADDFVCCVAGCGLSTRDIERLAWGYFKSPSLKDRIKNGDVRCVLRELKAAPLIVEGVLSDLERKVLWDLESISNAMDRIIRLKLEKSPNKNMAFSGKAGIFKLRLLETIPLFVKAVENL
jgi:predicted transcriptional regulator